MEASILLARLIGPILVVASLTTLFNPKSLQEIGREFMASPGMIYLAGFLALLGGLAVVNTHNRWVAGWPVIITVFGWLMVVGGVVRIGFPRTAISLGEAILARPTTLRVIAVIQLALGAFLMFVGYL